MKTRSVGIREAKVQLSKLVKEAKSGGEVVLTERGRPVCKIVPIETKSLPLGERVQRLEDQGVIERNSKEGAIGTRVPLPLPVSGDLAQKYLQADRDDAI